MSNFTVHKVVRWTEYNEYEGQMEGAFDEHPVTVYVQVYHEPDWEQYTPGIVVPAQLWLERSGAVERMEGLMAPELRQEKGVRYQAIGKVLAAEGEEVWLDSLFPLRVDMDWPVQGRERFPQFAAGDWLKVQGVLRLDLEGDEELSGLPDLSGL
jgi:hypothetical protein